MLPEQLVPRRHCLGMRTTHACGGVDGVPTLQIHVCPEYQSVTYRIRVALDPVTGSLKDTKEERHGHRGEATWRWRQRREGGGHQPRDGRPEPPEAGRGGEDPPLETLQGAQPWDTQTSDVWSPGLGEDGCLSGALSPSFIELSQLP